MNKQQGIISPIVIAIIALVAILGTGGYVAYTQYSEKITEEQGLETNTEDTTNNQQETNTEEKTADQLELEIAGWEAFYDKYGYTFEKKVDPFYTFTIAKNTVLFSPNNEFVSFIVVGYEYSKPYVVGVNNGVNILEDYNVWFDDPKKSIFWSSDGKTLVVKNYLNEFSGEGKEAILIKDESNKLKEIFSLSNQEYQNGKHIDNIRLLDNKILFSVNQIDYSYNLQTKTLSTLEFIAPTGTTADQQLKINNYNYSFIFTTDSVKVYDANNYFLQELKIGKDEMDSTKFSLKNYGHQIITANNDVNFDGYKDLAVEIGNGYGGVNFFYNFYYFNPTTKKFTEVPALKSVCNPNFKSDQKQILSSCKDGPGYSESIYQFGAAGYTLTRIPNIYRVDPESASVGALVGIYGNNFSGFEGDLNVWIENFSGVKGIIYGEKNISNDYEIKFYVPASVCQQDNSYTGFSCSATLQLIPGKYKIYVKPWGAKSNIVNFEIK